jgi:hypothetical protein
MKQLILSVLFAVMPATVASQDLVVAPRKVPAARRVDLSPDCSPCDGLSLCLPPVRGNGARARKTLKEKAGALSRLTLLAGLFMGRADAVNLGPLTFRINLELR